MASTYTYWRSSSAVGCGSCLLCSTDLNPSSSVLKWYVRQEELLESFWVTCQVPAENWDQTSFIERPTHHDRQRPAFGFKTLKPHLSPLHRLGWCDGRTVPNVVLLTWNNGDQSEASHQQPGGVHGDQAHLRLRSTQPKPKQPAPVSPYLIMFYLISAIYCSTGYPTICWL